ncbi:MAG: HPr kinase/phosphorylase [Candidatus Bathyarchaeia archaeon]
MSKSTYSVQLISPEEKDTLYQALEPRFLYTNKAEVYGCCIKLLTEVERVQNEWEDNFYTMSENTRSHGRLIVMEEPGKPLSVKYDPYTKTAFLTNVDYYGWIKSIALAVASDVLEDEHRIFGVHGAAIDVGCTGVSIIAPSGTGKTTHSWGLLRLPEARLVSDDWYFVRLSSREPLAFGSEKNCYIEADIGKIWKDYERLVDKATFDQKGRAVVNVRWIVGAGGVIPMTTMKTVVLLKRDYADKNIVTPMNAEEGLRHLLARDFCNPHQLVRDERKTALRKEFFRRYFDQTRVYLVNTTGTPQETQDQIRRVLGLKK